MISDGMKPLRAWKTKDEYWTAVANGIREVLEKLQREKSSSARHAMSRSRSATAG